MSSFGIDFMLFNALCNVSHLILSVQSKHPLRVHTYWTTFPKSFPCSILPGSCGQSLLFPCLRQELSLYLIKCIPDRICCPGKGWELIKWEAPFPRVKKQVPKGFLMGPGEESTGFQPESMQDQPGDQAGDSRVKRCWRGEDEMSWSCLPSSFPLPFLASHASPSDRNFSLKGVLDSNVYLPIR